jgi:hypothetical protein
MTWREHLAILLERPAYREVYKRELVGLMERARPRKHRAGWDDPRKTNEEWAYWRACRVLRVRPVTVPARAGCQLCRHAWRNPERWGEDANVLHYQATLGGEWTHPDCYRRFVERQGLDPARYPSGQAPEITGSWVDLQVGRAQDKG